MIAWLNPQRPLGRQGYLALGLWLTVLKLALDHAVAAAFGKVFTPVYYISPPDAPLFHPAGQEGYWIALWAVALPFIVVGMLLTLRRLADAELPRLLVLLFVVPFANLLFFVTIAAVPGRKPDPARTDKPDEPSFEPPASSNRAITGLLVGAVTGAVVQLGAVAVSVYALKHYGASVFFGAPLVAGFLAARTRLQVGEPTGRGAVAAALLGSAFACGVMVLLALEGAMCLVMAAPLVLSASALGAGVAWMLVRPLGPRPLAATPAVALLPLLLGVDALSPQPAGPARPVETIVEIDAPPDVVFRHVIAFDPLDEPTHWLFRAGVAAPVGATIDGEGVGAVRRCRFTTGEFVEPITVWKPGEELAFGVTAQPEPLQEQTLWPGPRPPHLDGYLQVERGRFLLEPLPGGRTRLIGTTWYRVRVFPRPYWRLWSDYVIHTIHHRVLAHIKRRAEAGPR